MIAELSKKGFTNFFDFAYLEGIFFSMVAIFFTENFVWLLNQCK